MEVHIKNNILYISSNVVDILGLEFIIKNYYYGYFVDNCSILAHIHDNLLDTYKQREEFMELFKNIIYSDKREVGSYFIELHPNFMYAELEFFCKLKTIYPTIDLYTLKKIYMIHNILCYYNNISSKQHTQNVNGYIDTIDSIHNLHNAHILHNLHSDNESNAANNTENNTIDDTESSTLDNTITSQNTHYYYRPGNFSFIHNNKQWREALTYDYNIIDTLHTDNTNYGIIGWEYLKKYIVNEIDIQYDYMKFTYDLCNMYDNQEYPYPVNDDVYEKMYHITQSIKMYPCHTRETQNESFKHMLYIAKYGWNRYVNNYMENRYITYV